MSQRAIRIAAAVLAFVVAAAAGVFLFGNFGTGVDPTTFINKTGADSIALILAVAALVAFVVYAAIEYAQTGAILSISQQFDTRTIVLIPLAIALNIIMGQAVGAALKIPIYLDSIGTILVGALAGPIPGALTGFLANVIWTYVVPPPFHSDISGAFAIVGAVIGLLAGTFGRLGWLRPRTGASGGALIAAGSAAVLVVGAMALYAYTRFYGGDAVPLFNPDNTDPFFTVLGYAVVLVAVLAVVGFFALLFVRRDVTVAYVVVSGVITGAIAAAISAPISANVFGGVTGAGTDFLVAAFRQGGSDIQTATFQQGLLSDPIDKLVTFFVVYLILSAMAVRAKARFPQGEQLVQRDDLEGARV